MRRLQGTHGKGNRASSAMSSARASRNFQFASMRGGKDQAAQAVTRSAAQSDLPQPQPASSWSETVFVPARVEAEVLEHLQVLLDGLVERGEIIADHERAGAGHENHALRVAQVHRASAGNHDFLPRQNEPEARDGLQDFQDGQGRILFKRRAGDGIEDVDGHDVRADFLERKREVAAVFARLAHADDAAGTNLDAGLFQIADGFEAVVVGVGGAGLREKPARTFEIVAVALDPGFLEPVGDLLAFDDAERDIGTGLAAGLQFADAVANFVEHRPFVQPFPRGDEADGGDAIFIRFLGGFLDGFGIHETVFGRAGLVK